jgi:hypothetical protein
MVATLAESLTSGAYGPLEIGGPLLRLDTTDWSTVESASLIARIASWLGSATE